MTRVLLALLMLLCPTLPQVTYAAHPALHAIRHDPAVASQIDALLRAMSHAALSGDAEAYMRCISSEDPEFRAEQLYFANDFRKKPPESLEITLDHDSVRAGDGSAFARLTYRWNMPTKKERAITFDARFDEIDGAWKFAGEEWKHHEQPGVRVLFDEGLDDAAHAAAEAFLMIRKGVEERFGFRETPITTRTQTIKLYSSMKHLQFSICLSYEAGLSGWNEPGEGIKILVSGTRHTPQRYTSVLAHEYGHVATFELGAKANDMPWWIIEGVAELMTHVVDEKAPERVRRSVDRWARAGTLADWNDLADFEKVAPSMTGRVYTQGCSFAMFVTSEFGDEGRTRWLRALAQGEPLERATRHALGTSFKALDARWRATLPPKDTKPEGEPAPEGGS